jgi:hypothetical protein
VEDKYTRATIFINNKKHKKNTKKTKNKNKNKKT